MLTQTRQRIIARGSTIKTIEQVIALEQQDNIIHCNKYKTVRFDFGEWRQMGVGFVDRFDVLSACIAGF